MQRFKKNVKIDSSLRTNQFFVDITDDTDDFYVLKVKFTLKKSVVVKNDLTSVTVRITNPDVVKNIQSPFSSYSPAGVGDGTVSTSESPLTRPSSSGTSAIIANRFKYTSTSPLPKDIDVNNAGNTSLSGASVNGSLANIGPEIPIYNPGPITTYSAQTNGGPPGPRMTLGKLTKNYSMIAKAAEASQTVIDTDKVTNIEQYISRSARNELKRFYQSSDRTKDITSIQSMYETVDVLEPQTTVDNVPISNERKMTQDSVKRANMQLLIDYKVDPANLLAEDAMTSRRSRESNLVIQKKSEYPHVEKIKRYYEIDSTESFKRSNRNAQYKLVKRRLFWDRLDLYATLRLPKSLQIPTANIEFYVYKADNVPPVDIQTRNLSIIPLTDAYDSRIDAVPQISGLVHNNLNNFAIKSEESKINADAIVMTRKIMGPKGNFTMSNEISKKNIFENKPVYVKSNTAPGRISIHKSYFYNSKNNIKSSRYRSIVTGDMDYDPAILVVTAPRQVHTAGSEKEKKRGISFEVKNLPRMPNEWVVGWNVRWDNGQGGYDQLTRKSSDWLSVDPNSDSLLYEWDPKGKLQPRSSYKMELMYKFNTGRTKSSYISEYRWIRSAYEDEVTTSITDITYNASSMGPMLTFRITTIVPPKAMNKIVESFKASRVFEDFAGYFDNSSTSDLYRKIVQHKVDRINLETSERVTFGDFGLDNANLDSGEYVFNDTPEVRQRLKIDYDPTASYFYEVRVSLADPITMLPDYATEKDIVLPGGAVKRIRYNPFTWYQPNFLGTGVLPALDERNRPIINANDDFHEPGEIGVTAVYATNGDMIKEYKVRNLTTSRIDINTVKVTWSVIDEELYDHYVVVKEVNGVKKMLDITHTTYVYDDVEYQESGNVAYYVTPVFSNYTVGATSKSNAVFFDNNDFIVPNSSVGTVFAQQAPQPRS